MHKKALLLKWKGCHPTACIKRCTACIFILFWMMISTFIGLRLNRWQSRIIDPSAAFEDDPAADRKSKAAYFALTKLPSMENWIYPDTEVFEERTDTAIDVRKANFPSPMNVTTNHSGRRLADYETRSDHVAADAPGEDSQPVSLDSFGELNKEAFAIFQKEAFNLLASDLISLQRKLTNFRSEKCVAAKYDLELPTASVIIVFYDEPMSTLLRTVWSVINRSRPEYLREVILVDDGSTRLELHKFLENELKASLLEKVRLVRLQHGGLIRAKLHGAEIASGEVLVFMDAHCEANVGWLEPLLSRIKENRKTIVCPMVDTIDAADFTYSPSAGWATGLFTWSLFYKWGPNGMTDAEKKRVKDPDSEPHRTPTFPGGLFAMERKWFFEVGSYDDAMKGWGGENLEMSFRVWMCGGSIEFHPCSRVAHISRGHTYSREQEDKNHGINSARLAEVWLDDYKRLFFAIRPDLSGIVAEETSKRKELRTRLGCHDFGWYLQNVYPEKFVPDENVIAWGQLLNPESDVCLQAKKSDDHVISPFFATRCWHSTTRGHWLQIFSLSLDGELRREEWCLDVSDSSPKEVVSQLCSSIRRKWTHDETSRLYNHNSQRCLTVGGISSKKTAEVFLAPCSGSTLQNWRFQHYNESRQSSFTPSAIL